MMENRQNFGNKWNEMISQNPLPAIEINFKDASKAGIKILADLQIPDFPYEIPFYKHNGDEFEVVACRLTYPPRDQKGQFLGKLYLCPDLQTLQEMYHRQTRSGRPLELYNFEHTSWHKAKISLNTLVKYRLTRVFGKDENEYCNKIQAVVIDIAQRADNPIYLALKAIHLVEVYQLSTREDIEFWLNKESSNRS